MKRTVIVLLLLTCAAAQTARPKPDDLTPTGKPKYVSNEQYIEALIEWKMRRSQPVKAESVTLCPNDAPRFQVHSAGSGYENFIWVLDTQTGEVWGYRFVAARNENNETVQRIQEVPHI